ncbi:MAG: hypothetical protein DDT40_00830 [candidate division WS2 bacterium]|uniref:Site-2 protease family protein n=1 Tax=Psychracetigena formicireducens TaxID=2986056 RepID=A0A9E2F659_PSYF1|nr:hypothetical protein [Candidatus Psychracetigena formicireducens]MBT9145035.1 hypothetical protein [Candidatus Psychracetigena formicireducens]MBT9150655.1 hypothetical protein [Candidatus Psychracetigena formicireducens]
MFSFIDRLFTLDNLLLYGALLLAFTIHEFAHAWVTDKLGDPTPRYLKRLTLNPLRHIDLLGLLALIIFRVGWGKPVPINHYYYKNPKRDLLLTSVAGVSANLALALIATLLLIIVNRLPFLNLFYLQQFLVYVGIYSIVLMLFNLLPLPPLDGFKAFLLIFIPRPFRYLEDQQMNFYGILILIVMLYTGFISGYIGFGVELFTTFLYAIGAL